MNINTALDPEIQKLVREEQKASRSAHLLSATELRKQVAEKRVVPTDIASVHEVTNHTINTKINNIACRALEKNGQFWLILLPPTTEGTMVADRNEASLIRGGGTDLAGPTSKRRWKASNEQTSVESQQS